MYARVVGEGGVDPGYFLDKMSFVEVSCFLDGLNRRNRESWEQTRIVSYIIAQANSTKKLEQSDILCFPWDEKEDVADKCTTVTGEEMARLRAMAKQVEDELKDINHG